MKWALGVVAVVMFGPLVFTAVMVGQFVQPFAQWRFGQRGVGTIPLGDMPLGPPILGPQPLITDFQRYRLAVDAGFSPSEAVIATAISIAENGGGSPTALSGANRDGSRDLGLWQINSGWWPRFGGHDALTDPVRNAIAARYIFGVQGWCAWSVYEASCGPGHVGTYRQYMNRARTASQ